MIPDPTVKMLDFQFLNDSQIICSSIRITDSGQYPCFDIYDIPKTHVPVEEGDGLLNCRALSTMNLAASFQLPSLSNPQPGCLWKRRTKTYSHISEFAIRLPRFAGLNAFIDQAMTFRLEGRNGGKSEKFQGVILLSRLVETMDQVVNKDAGGELGATGGRVDHTPFHPGSTTTESIRTPKVKPHIDDYHRVSFKWEEWSSTVSLQQATSSTVLEPKCTLVASIARSRTDKTRAVMVIRDYNQQMLYAPPGHLNRNLGHPTDNCEPGKQKEEDERLASPFRVVSEPRSLHSILFGRAIEYGLGHRMRTIPLGEYSYNTATSRLFWDGNYMKIVPATTTAVSSINQE